MDNPITKTVDLVLTNVDTLVWNGTPDGVWDINNSYNWFVNPTATDGRYQENMVVLFDDTATGTAAVDLTVAVAPANVTVNNSTTTYSIAGIGAINGATALTKLGTGTLTLSTVNTYLGRPNLGRHAGNRRRGSTGGGTYGALITNNGTLSFNSTANQTLSGPVTNSGTLNFNGTGSQTLVGVISGAGKLRKSNTGTLKIVVANTYTGTTTITTAMTLRACRHSGQYPRHHDWNRRQTHARQCVRQSNPIVSHHSELTINGTLEAITGVPPTLYATTITLNNGTMNSTTAMTGGNYGEYYVGPYTPSPPTARATPSAALAS